MNGIFSIVHVVPSLLFLVMALSSAAVKEDATVLPFSESKLYSRSFALKPGSQVELVSKYGDIRFRTWQKDSVSFETTIVAESEQEEYMNALLEMAEMRYRTGGGITRAELVLGEKLSTVKRSSIELKLNVSKNHRLKVDHVVYIPEWVVLSVENRFGDVEMPSLKGRVMAKVNHGDLRAEQLTDMRLVEVKYGKIIVESIEKGEVALMFGSMKARSVGDVVIQSSGSTLEIESAFKVQIKSSNDKIYLEKIRQIGGSSSFTDFRIGQLESVLDLSLRFGSCIVRSVDPKFERITIECGTTDVELRFDPAASLGFDLVMDNPRSVVVHSASKKITRDEKQEKRQIITGSFGKQADPELKLNIKSRAGNIRIEQ